MTENTPDINCLVDHGNNPCNCWQRIQPPKTKENTPEMNTCPACGEEAKEYCWQQLTAAQKTIEELSKTSEWEAKYKTMAAAFRAREAEFNRSEKELKKEKQRLDSALKTIEELKNMNKRCSDDN